MHLRYMKHLGQQWMQGAAEGSSRGLKEQWEPRAPASWIPVVSFQAKILPSISAKPTTVYPLKVLVSELDRYLISEHNIFFQEIFCCTHSCV